MIFNQRQQERFFECANGGKILTYKNEPRQSKQNDCDCCGAPMSGNALCKYCGS